MPLNVYLNFDGNCRAAFEHYKAVFGGDYMAFETFEGAPPDMPVAEKDKKKVMHVSLPIGESTLMGSDWAEGFGDPLVTGNNFSVSVVGDDKEHCDELFARLTDGGEVKMPMAETFWGSYFGMCRDKFDINWMVSFDPTPPDQKA